MSGYSFLECQDVESLVVKCPDEEYQDNECLNDECPVVKFICFR